MKIEKNNSEKGLILIPRLQKFFKNKQKNTSLMWIPVESALIFDTSFQELTIPTRAIFIQLLLLCGVHGNYEIPLNIKYLAGILGVNRCRIRSSLGELFSTGLCVENTTPRETERKERKEEYSTDSTERESVAAVERGVISDFGIRNADLGLETTKADTKAESRNHNSNFTIEECLRYVEICRSKGEDIKNPKGLANHLFQTGNADAFILAALYPKKQEEIERETYGKPRQFTDEPCKSCYGAKMADTDGKGFRKCTHCRDEKGKATGFEPVIGDK